MAWGTITIGPLTLKETDILEDVTNANSGERSVRFEGRETVPGATLAEVQAKLEDFMQLIGRTVPVSFSRKANYNGFYTVADTNAEYEHWVEGPAQIRWSISLNLVANDGQADMESAIANVVRANDFALTGERWHAPSIGHKAYQVGTSIPSIVSRTSSDGDIAVYRSIPAGVNPRWAASVASFPLGRARITQGGIERTGTGVALTPTGWTAHNGLVRVRPDTGSGTFLVGLWNSGAWAEKSWAIKVSTVVITPADMQYITVTRNDYEMVTLRIVVQLPASSARHIVDVSIRRGSRLLEGYVQRPSSGTIAVTPTIAEASTDNSASGYMVAAGDDLAGNQYVVGSARSFTADANGGISKAAVTALDFFIAAMPGGTSLGITDGTFETSTAGWTATGGTFTRVNDQFKVGSWAGKLVVTGTPTQAFVRPDAVTVTPGTKYRVSFWARSLDGATVGCAIDWQTSGVYVSTDVGSTVLTAGSWVYLSFEATAPVGANEAVYGPTLGGSPPTGETIWVDQVQFRTASASGDSATDLRNQYIGAMAEKVGVVRR